MDKPKQLPYTIGMLLGIIAGIVAGYFIDIIVPGPSFGIKQGIIIGIILGFLFEKYYGPRPKDEDERGKFDMFFRIFARFIIPIIVFGIVYYQNK